MYNYTQIHNYTRKYNQKMEFEDRIVSEIRVCLPNVSRESVVRDATGNEITTFDVLCISEDNNIHVAIQITEKKRVEKGKVAIFIREIEKYKKMMNPPELHGIFLSENGLSSRLVEECNKNNIFIAKSNNILDIVCRLIRPNVKKPDGIVLRDFQRQIRDRIIADESLTVFCPTGSGKTIAVLSGLAGIYEKVGPPYLCLWTTEYKNILQSQFTAANVTRWKQSGIIPEETKIHFYDQFSDYFHENNSDKFAIIIANIDKLLPKKNKISELSGKINAIIFDECHHVTGPKTFEFLREIREKMNTSGKRLIGISATPSINDKRHTEIFGDNIFSYTILEAIRDKVIAPIKIKFMSMMISSGKSAGETRPIYKSPRNIADISTILKSLSDLLRETPNRKGILWCKDQYSADDWYDILSESDLPVKFCMHHTRHINVKEYMEFVTAKSDIVMIAVDMFREGFDCKNIDFCGFLDPQTHNLRTILQTIGRATRLDRPEKTGIFCEFIVADDPVEYEHTIRNKLLDYYSGINLYGDQSRQIHHYCPPVVKKTSDSLIELTEPEGHKICEIELIDSPYSFELFKLNGKQIADFLNKCGLSLKYSDIQQILSLNNIKDSNSAIKYLDSSDPSAELSRWWQIAKYQYINWFDLLQLNSADYYSFDEAKSAMKEIATKLDSDDINFIRNNVENFKIYESVFRKYDGKLPANPVDMYLLDSLDELYAINRKKMIKYYSAKLS